MLGQALLSGWPVALWLLAWAWATWRFGGPLTPPALSWGLVGGILGLLALVDMRRQILPISGTLWLAYVGLQLAPWGFGLGWQEMLLGSAAVTLLLLGCAVLAGWLAGKPALGGGDLLLVLALGLWVGGGGVPLWLLATALSGVLWVLWRRWRGATGQKMAFGPMLALGGWLAVGYKDLYWALLVNQ